MSRLVLSTGLAAFCAIAPAAAQTSQPPAATRSIDVTAPALPTPTAPSVEDARKDIKRVPGAANVVASEEFRSGSAISLRDVLENTPGIYVQQRWAEEVRLSIRGSGIANNNHLFGVRLLQDGIPFNLADGSGDYQEIDPLNIRHLEVYRGANALQYGSSTLGGAINAVSPTGRSAAGYLARAEVGTDGYGRSQLAAGGAKGGWDYYGSATWSLAEGYRKESDTDNRRFAANTGYSGAGFETRFFVFGNRIQQRIPGSLTRAQWDASPFQPSPANVTARAARNIDSFRFANRTSFLAGETEVTIGTYATDRSLFHPLSFGIVDNETNDYGTQVRTVTEGRIGAFRNAFVLGGGYAYGTNDSRTFVNNRGYRGALNRFAYQRSANAELFAENQFYVTPTVALVTGAQAVSADRRSEDRFNVSRADTGQKRFNSLNPKAGLLWDASRDVQVFGNVSRTYQAPRFSDLNPSAAAGFIDLAAQHGVTAEIGTRGRVADIGFDVAIYRANLKKELLVYAVGAGATQTQNADRTTHQGLEAGVDLPLAQGLLRDAAAERDSLRWRQIYNLSDFRFVDDRQFGSNRLPVVPKHFLRSELRYDNGGGLFVAPNLEWIPVAPYVDSANSVRTEPYVLFGARAGYKFAENFEVFADGRNLANKAYIADATTTSTATAATNYINPGLGRTFVVGIEAKW